MHGMLMFSTQMIFHGRFNARSFGAFLRARAKRLGLHLVMGELGAKCCVVTIAGQVGLVDAFEMACSLGPMDCLVLAVERRPAPAIAA